MADDWTATRDALQHMVAREGVRNVAQRIPAHYTTVYRLISGEHEHPCRAVQANIERLVHEAERLPRDPKP